MMKLNQIMMKSMRTSLTVLGFTYLSLVLSQQSFARIDGRHPDNKKIFLNIDSKNAGNNSTRIEVNSIVESTPACGNEDPGMKQGRAPFYIYYPSDASGNAKTTQSYAVVLFLHGIGGQASLPNLCWNHSAATYQTISNNMKKVYNEFGPNRAIEDKQFTTPEPLIVIAPQSMSWGTFPAEIIQLVMNDAIDQLQQRGVSIDLGRTYISGLSMGGGATNNYITKFPNHFAAAFPIEAASPGDACTIINSKIPFWGFAGTSAGQMYKGALATLMRGTAECPQQSVEYDVYRPSANYTCRFEGASCTTVLASDGELRRGTLMPGHGHSGWYEVYKGTLPSIPKDEKFYDWLLRHRNSGFPINVSSSGVALPLPSATPAVVVTSTPGPVAVASPTPSPSPSSVVAAPLASPTPVAVPPVVVVPIPSSTPTNPSPVSSFGPSEILPLNKMSVVSALPEDYAGRLIDGIVGVDSSVAFAPNVAWNTALYPRNAVIDLGQITLVSQVEYYQGNGSGTVRFAYLPEGQLPALGTFVSLATGSGGVWGKYNSASPFSAVVTRYIQVSFSAPAEKSNVSEIRITGKKALPPVVIVAPVPTFGPIKVIPNSQMKVVSALAEDNAERLIDGIVGADASVAFAPNVPWNASLYPRSAIIDLGEIVQVNQIEYYRGNGSGTVRIAYLPEAQTLAQGTFIDLGTGVGGNWGAYNLISSFSPKVTRYIRVSFSAPSEKMNISEIKITGRVYK